MNKAWHINRRKEIKSLLEHRDEVVNNWLPYASHMDHHDWTAQQELRAIDSELMDLAYNGGGRATKAILEVYDVDEVGSSRRVIIANKKRVVAIIKTPINLFQKQEVTLTLLLSSRPGNIKKIGIKTQIKGDLC